jgi:DNA-binding transcriptional MerR regulator/ubiquinone/menaquinone biosynthesis C-methylase UbiE
VYLISEVAKQVEVSRTALLYYEKLGIITGKRSGNGYRFYTEADVQRIKLLQLLIAGGLTLNECKLCLDTKLDRSILERRIQELDEEIERKQESRKLLDSMLGIGGSKDWHAKASILAPQAHIDWLLKQGFTLKEALRLKWLSKNMNEHDQYMTDFMKVFEGVERWGPGSEADTLKALSAVPHTPSDILHVGCGKCLATRILAKNSSAMITAVDNEQSALDHLSTGLEKEGLKSRVKTLCVSMTDMPFEEISFDLIWSENSAYVMGVEKALKSWSPFLKADGILMISDLVWLTKTPNQEAVKFWEDEYPDMQTIDSRKSLFEANKLEIVDSFTISKLSWENYYLPLKDRITDVKGAMSDSTAIKDISHEINIFEKYLGEFGYQMFILKKS